jgi:hypothetical protein
VIIFFAWFFREPIARCDVCFDADDWLYAVLFCRFIEFDRAIKDTMVREGDGVHPEFFRARYELIDLCEPIKKRIMRVRMKMSEFRHVFFVLPPQARMLERKVELPLHFTPGL